MGWLEGYQIRLWPRSRDNVLLFLLPGPHNELLLGLGYISSGGPTRARAGPTFPGQGPSHPRQPPWLFWTWNEWVMVSRAAGRGLWQLSRLWGGGKLMEARMELALDSAERGSHLPRLRATHAVSGEPPGPSGLQPLSSGGLS